MDSPYDDQFEFECPQCQHEYSRTIRQLRDQPHFNCPGGCGRVVRANELISALDRIDKALDDLADSFGDDITI